MGLEAGGSGVRLAVAVGERHAVIDVEIKIACDLRRQACFCVEPRHGGVGRRYGSWQRSIVHENRRDLVPRERKISLIANFREQRQRHVRKAEILHDAQVRPSEPCVAGLIAEPKREQCRLFLVAVQIRMRVGGQSAGHNGVQSVIQQLGPEFGRIRIGIKNEHTPKDDTSSFVLGTFSAQEKPHVASLVNEASLVANEYIYGGTLPHDTRSIILL